jgi:hypothetical protein
LRTQQVCNHEAASLFAETIMELVDRRRTDHVIVVGAQNIELVVQLARHGFLDVTCRSMLTGPTVGTRSAGIIIVPGVDRVPEWPAVVPRLARALRPGGVLVLRWSGSSSAVRLRQLQKLLSQHGFSFIRKHLEGLDLDVLCCRKAAAFAAEAA